MQLLPKIRNTHRQKTKVKILVSIFGFMFFFLKSSRVSLTGNPDVNIFSWHAKALNSQGKTWMCWTWYYSPSNEISIFRGVWEYLWIKNWIAYIKRQVQSFNIVFLVLGNSTRKLANDTTLGAMDFALLQNEENVTNRRSQKYTQYSNTNRYDIGKYAAENGNANAVRFFQKDFPKH